MTDQQKHVRPIAQSEVHLCTSFAGGQVDATDRLPPSVLSGGSARLEWGLPGTSWGDGAEAVLDDPNVDAVVIVLMLTDETGIPPLDFITGLAEKYPDKPLYVTFTGQKHHAEAATAILEPRVPCFPLLEQPFDVLGILSRACLPSPGLTGGSR